MAVDVESVRRDFPVLETGLIYFDNAATTLTPVQVVREMERFYLEVRANVHRGLHRLSMEATREYEEAHKEVARFLNAEPDEVAFTKNATEGLNLVASGLGLRKGDAVVVTVAEHHANLLPWMRLRERAGVELRVVPVSGRGEYDLEALAEAARGARVVSVHWVSNVLGSVAPLDEFRKVAREEGAYFVVDGAQGVPHMKTDVKKMDADFLAFSGHKMLGPTGVGVLYYKRELAEELDPLLVGGGMIRDVSLEGFEPADPPEKFEGGTPPIAEAVGLAEAVRYLGRIGMDWVERHERRLTSRLLRGLSEIEGVEYYGPGPEGERAAVVSFNVRGVNPHDVASVLDELGGVAVRSGHHCALPLVRGVLGVEGTVRASLYLYNTEEEVERFLEILAEIAGGLG
ncbi:MAG: cysteine desulfurase [Thermoproteota archaeon]|nr:MAG: cysteine desulfurase [Candidatus Korarchaeota archaeon]